MTARPTTADLAEKYRRYLESRLEQNKFEHELAEKRIPQPTKSKMGQPGSFTVGIVGGGMAGLYSALLLRNLGIPVKIFEAENRERQLSLGMFYFALVAILGEKLGSIYPDKPFYTWYLQCSL